MSRAAVTDPGPIRFRRTIRTRLTLGYTLLMLILAGVMLLAIYLFMRYAPTYDFPTTGAGKGSAVTAAGPVLTPDPTAEVEPAVASPVATLTVRSTSTLLSTLLLASGSALALLVVLAAGVGWVATGRMLHPLHEITAAAKRASSGRLDHRIALAGPPDELKDLSDTFDVMLARLEQAFHAHQRFAANASHELRTPLATTQAILDVALADPDSHDVSTLARKLRVANTQSLTTVDALLDLADTAQGHLDGQSVEIAAVVEQAVSAVAAEARDLRIGLEVRLTQCVVRADPVLLRQFFVNLLQNAVRHNTPGGTATVVVSVNEGSVTVKVRNTGDVVPDAMVPLLAEPFYRGAGRTAGNGRGPRGRGLGLALAATIAAAHGSSLELSANPQGGLTAGITLPV